MPTPAKDKTPPQSLSITLSAEHRLQYDHVGIDRNTSMDALVSQCKAAVQQQYPQTRVTATWLEMKRSEDVVPWPASESDRTYFKQRVSAIIENVWLQSKWVMPTHPTTADFLKDLGLVTLIDDYMEELTKGLLFINSYDPRVYQLQKYCFANNKPTHISTCTTALKEHIQRRIVASRKPIVTVTLDTPATTKPLFNMPKIVAAKKKPSTKAGKDGVW